MNKEIEKFIINRQKKGSCLLPVAAEIMYMRSMDVPYSGIKEWLYDKYQIETSAENIRKFTNRYTMNGREVWSDDFHLDQDKIGKIWVLDETGEPYLAEEVIDV